MCILEKYAWDLGYTFKHGPGVDLTKGLKPRLRLKFKTLVLNFVNRMGSLYVRFGAMVAEW